jgi:hypothetical protein
MNIPRSINSYDKLRVFVNCIRYAQDRGDRLHHQVIFYTPWDKAAKKIKGIVSRVNLFDLPDAYSIMRREFNLPENLNYVPTLLTFEVQNGEVSVRFVDNCTAIQHELVSG